MSEKLETGDSCLVVNDLVVFFASFTYDKIWLFENNNTPYQTIFNCKVIGSNKGIG